MEIRRSLLAAVMAGAMVTVGAAGTASAAGQPPAPAARAASVQTTTAAPSAELAWRFYASYTTKAGCDGRGRKGQGGGWTWTAWYCELYSPGVWDLYVN